MSVYFRFFALWRHRNATANEKPSIEHQFYALVSVAMEKHAPNVGLEPTTVGLRVQRSTDWASRARLSFSTVKLYFILKFSSSKNISYRLKSSGESVMRLSSPSNKIICTELMKIFLFFGFFNFSFGEEDFDLSCEFKSCPYPCWDTT